MNTAVPDPLANHRCGVVLGVDTHRDEHVAAILTPMQSNQPREAIIVGAGAGVARFGHRWWPRFDELAALKVLFFMADERCENRSNLTGQDQRRD